MQYLIWTTRDAGDLDRCETVLKARRAFVSITHDHGLEVVEGRNPDDIPVILLYPAVPGVGITSLSSRIYAY